NGCIRMKNRDVIRIFRIIPPGTKVLITKENRSFEDIAIERKALIKKQETPLQ
ncbi:L,D-transpeptidase, partial [Bacillus velezensis]